MFELNADNISALLTLTGLEIVLGIDNIVFLSILVGKLPEHQQKTARLIGLGLAMFARLGLLFTISWIMMLTNDVLWTFSGRDLILLAGGVFLIWKATHEIHERIEGDPVKHATGGVRATFASVIFQIILIDLVFSLDSVITAVGIAKDISIMVIAVIISVMCMMAFAGSIARFIERHPTFKMLALSFLILIGVLLVAESFGKHVERAYVYFAMAFSFAVELLNTKERTKRTVGASQ